MVELGSRRRGNSVRFIADFRAVLVKLNVKDVATS